MGKFTVATACSKILPENEKFSVICKFIDMDSHISVEILSVGHSVSVSWLPTPCQVFCKVHNLALRGGQNPAALPPRLQAGAAGGVWDR